MAGELAIDASSKGNLRRNIGSAVLMRDCPDAMREPSGQADIFLEIPGSRERVQIDAAIPFCSAQIAGKAEQDPQTGPLSSAPQTAWEASKTRWEDEK